MATKTKPLPYRASHLVAGAIALNNEAVTTLRQMIDKPLTSEERFRLLAKVVDKLHQSTGLLKEIATSSVEALDRLNTP